MKVSTNDIYESAFLLLKSCELQEIEGTRVNGKIVCNLILTGENINKLQLDYLNGKATANILDLRRMLGQVHSWVNSARKKIKNQLREQELHSQSTPEGGVA